MTCLPLSHAPQLTGQQRANLARLAAHLESLPADYQHFSMKVFLASHSGASARRAYLLGQTGMAQLAAAHPCGAAACALGHGPDAGVRPLREHWLRCGYRCGLIRWEHYAGLFCSSRADHQWLFGGYWFYADNTHQGAAARIRYALAGLPLPSADLLGTALLLSGPQRSPQLRALYATFLRQGLCVTHPAPCSADQ